MQLGVQKPCSAADGLANLVVLSLSTGRPDKLAQEIVRTITLPKARARGTTCRWEFEERRVKALMFEQPLGQDSFVAAAPWKLPFSFVHVSSERNPVTPKVHQAPGFGSVSGALTHFFAVDI
jgi:hypothetical protein